MSELVVTGLRRSFGSVIALDGVDLRVPEGNLAAVLGPSGCGKTTLLRCIAGFDRTGSGEILAGGQRLNDLPPERRRITIVPQEGALFPHLTVAANVGYGLDRATRRSGRIDEVLALVGLADQGNRMPHELSGGQQQRVAVARALAPRPSLVLLDEPFSALDATLRGDLRRDIRAALHADGATAVLVTHDQNEALSIADQITVMRDGRVRQTGTPHHVYTEPVDPWVATFVGDAVLLPATIRGTTADTELGDIPVSNHFGAGPATILLRPEQIHLGPGAAATVTTVDYHGHDAVVGLRLTQGTVVKARVTGIAPIPGTQVGTQVSGEARTFPAS